MKKIFVLTTMSLLTLFGWSQTMNIHFKSGQAEKHNMQTIEFIEFTETNDDEQESAAVLRLAQNEFLVSEKGGTITVEVISNVDFDVDMPDAEWIHEVSSTQEGSSHSICYVVSPNEANNSRSARIVYSDKNSNLQEILTVIQQGKMPSATTVLHVDEAGTLGSFIAEDRRRSLTEIKITGNLNLSDIKVIDQMVSLQILDLSEAKIVGGDVYEYYFMPPGTYSSTIQKIRLEDNTILGAMLPSSVMYFYAPKTLKNIRGFHWGSHVISSFNSYVSENNSNTSRSRSKLKKINLQDSLTEIGTAAFAETSLEEVDLPDNILNVANYAFFDCSLNHITFGSKLRSIGQYAFAYNKLSNINLPEGLEEVRKGAFYRCHNKNIYFPSTLKRVEESAFGHTYNNLPDAISVYIPSLENWLTIDFASENANPLYESNWEIETSLYVDNSLIQSLVIPHSFTGINNYAFAGCSSIQDVTIGDQVETIGEKAFYNCSNLSKLTIGDGVSTIPSSTFKGCKSLEIVRLGKNVSSVSGAFSGTPCNEVHCLSTTPPSISTSDLKVNKETAKLYVPMGSYQKYFLSNWGAIFSNIIEVNE